MEPLAVDEPSALEDYAWIVTLGGIAAFFAAFGIGANDVANAFATSVGSRAITVRQACVLAVIFELAGAVLMGSHVTRTIRKSIADVTCFVDEPEVLMFGCLCVIVSVGAWLILASKLEMPVSTTHSCVGGMIGMTLVAKGTGCVVWAEPSVQFPYYTGVAAIVISWVLSPVLAATMAVLLFSTVRRFVLRAKDPLGRAFGFYPLLVGLTLAVNAFFITYKGGKALGLQKTKMSTAAMVSFAIAAVGAVCAVAVGKPLRARIEKEWAAKAAKEARGDSPTHELVAAAARSDDNDFSSIEPGPSTPISPRMSPRATKNLRRPSADMPLASRARWALSRLADRAMSGGHDAHAVIETDPTVEAIHANAEKFDPKAEAAFRYLQVFTACCDAFAHGANDVANAIGPFAAIVSIYINGQVTDKADMGEQSYRILLLGGLGIAAGLLLYGYKIMRAIGVKLAAITPSRGFAIELGAAMVIILGSRMGWPLSTTHCQVGATAGVALLEGKGGINKRILLKTGLGWVITIVVVGTSTAAIFAFGVYAPSVHCAA